MPKQSPIIKREPAPEEIRKRQIRDQFALMAPVIETFQTPQNDNDPLRAPDERTRTLLDIVTVFQLYKISALKSGLALDYEEGFATSQHRTDTFAYFEAVNDVLRAMVYGAPYESVLPPTPEQPAHDTHTEIFNLLAHMNPPAGVFVSDVQATLMSLTDLLRTDGFELAREAVQAIDETFKGEIAAIRLVREEAQRKLRLRPPGE